jgi:phosphoglycolate phosphatase
MPYSLAIFDLDGTLADSFPWFLRTVNDVADHFRFRRVADGDVEALRHASPRELIAYMQVPLWKLPSITRHMRKLKADASAEIKLFDGVETMLRALTDDGVQLALVSSDSETNARHKLGDLAALFSHFDCAASLFGKPAKFRRVIRRAGVDPAESTAARCAGAMPRRKHCRCRRRIFCSSAWKILRRLWAPLDTRPLTEA